MKTWIVTAAAVLTLGLTSLTASAGEREDQRLVQSWYRQYLGRPADSCGLRDWTKAVSRCHDPLPLEAAFLASDEYYHRWGCTPEGFFTGLYADVLGRGACPREINAWTCQLGRCGCRKTMALNFLRAARIELAEQMAPPVYQPAPVYQPVRVYVPVAPRPVPVVREPPSSLQIGIRYRSGR